MLITWHSGEFSEKSPEGGGTEFAVTGGEVEPGGRFAILLGPKSAELVGPPQYSGLRPNSADSTHSAGRSKYSARPLTRR